jgi:hypothetical protein
MPKQEEAEVTMTPSQFAEKYLKVLPLLIKFAKDIKAVHHELVNLNNTLVAKRAELRKLNVEIEDARRRAKMKYGSVDGKLVEIAGA